MNPFLQNMSGTTTGTLSHAHLLVTESGGIITPESPAAVMDEVEFRTTHVSSLLAEMFEEAKRHDNFWSFDEA